MQRTKDNQLSSTLKRGDYALSQKREHERQQAHRTLDPRLQEVNRQTQGQTVTGCNRRQNARNYQTTFKITDQNT